MTTLATVAITVFAMAGLAFADNADGLHLLPHKKNVTSLEGTLTKSSGEVTPLKTVNAKASGKTESILVDEDFSKMTSGTVNAPDTTQMLACEWTGYSPNGVYIDNSLTSDGTWLGHQVYSAGGAVAIKTYNPQQPAYLCTPLGDYSGDITVTVKAKAIKDVIRTDTGFAYGTGSSLSIQACTGGIEGQDEANTDDENEDYEVRLYESQGWQKITYTFKNYSADKDGFIKFSTEGAVVLDDIEVTTGASFLASPKGRGITDFQKDNFSIAWDPVRKSFNYYVDLYTRNYLTDNDTTYVADFEDGTVPAGFETTSTTIADNEGADNSKALVLKNGETLLTPTNGNDYRKLHFYMHVVDPSVEEYGDDAFWYVSGSIDVEYKADGKWNEVGYFDAGNFYSKGKNVVLENEVEDLGALHATQWRIKPSYLNDGAYLVIDNIEATVLPGFEYKIVDSAYGTEDLSDNYTVTDMTKNTEYTFTGLDSLTEYWYGVRSHFVYQFSDRNYTHALGVATPDVKDPTDVDSRGSFTANWTAVPKATSYTATCYGYTLASEDNDTYPLLEEDFDKVDADVTEATDPSDADPLGNSEQTALDDYTSLPGWLGVDNTLVQGMIGAEGNYYNVGGVIATPVLDLTHGSTAKLTLKLYGDAGDQIIVYVDGTRYGVTIPDEGVIDATYTLPVKGERGRINFWSATDAPFVLDYIKLTQSVKKGEQVLTQLAAGTTEGNTSTSYTFTGLDAYPFDLYAYDVVAHYKYSDSEIATSLKSSDLKIVDLNGTATAITSQKTTDGVKEVARYTADGRRVSAPVKGINIVKMSDGTAKKVIIK